ncbi:hypothetical protein HUG15_13085 [Salicibibacter cibarius]|uniref:Uncharacterized protein n=1 Tax=Salicibibacter cibarius TaxID=2743000 RepID=A0A7T6Z420_9BACI|nr:hypothetical protein [Salicibibacter cibarius]QQK76401.1 hypothetical protein HUG15_13085 [Salicibibacter cibarius]
MPTIHYVKDENGQAPVFDLIYEIALRGMEDKGYANLAKYIAQALDYLEDVGVPEKKFLPFYTERDNGRPLTFATILKELTHHSPLLEFRVNWRGTGYFRAIFFCVEDESEQILLEFRTPNNKGFSVYIAA